MQILQLYDRNHTKIKGLKAYKDLKIESVLSSSDGTLSFLYPLRLSKEIEYEGYIRTKDQEYVIKEVPLKDDWNEIVAVLNLEELTGMPIQSFDTTEQTISDCIKLAIAGTGYTLEMKSSITKKRTVRMTNSTSLEVLNEIKEIYLVDMVFDTINKKVFVYEKLGSDKGAYFIDSLNLKELEVSGDSYDFFTNIIALGKTDDKTGKTLKVELSNHQYSNKNVTLLWVDERYTVLESLRADAEYKLNELSKPKRCYAARVYDLANLNPKYKNILNYSLGDTITLVNKEKGIKEKQRIVKIIKYPNDPEKNEVELSNTVISFEDLMKSQKQYESTVDNITEDNGTISESAVRKAINSLTINHLNVNDLNAVTGRIGQAFINYLKADVADIKEGIIGHLISQKADIDDLDASKIKFVYGEGQSLTLHDLLSQFISSEDIQTMHFTSSNVVIDEAVIKDIVSKHIAVGDLLAGEINTNKFTITSEDGGIVITKNTQQFKDKKGNVRVQIGEDAEGNFNFIVVGEDGSTALIDENGITKDAIPDKVIVNDMVADNANISGSKLDINSVLKEANENGTETLNSTKVKLDETGQTLDIAFKKVSNDSSDAVKKVNTIQTDLKTTNGKIDGLIKDTTIEEKGKTKKLKDKYIEIKADVDGFEQKVSSAKTEAEKYADNAISKLHTSLKNTEFKQTAEQINAKASKTDVTKYVQEAGAKNYISNGCFTNGYDNKGDFTGLDKWSKTSTGTILSGVSSSGYRNSLSLTSTAAWQGVWQVIENLEVGNTYTFSGYMWNASGKKCKIIILSYTDATFKTVSKTAEYKAVKDGWQWGECTFIPNTKYVRVYFESYDSGAGTWGQSCVTALTLKKGTIRGDWSENPDYITGRVSNAELKIAPNKICATVTDGLVNNAGTIKTSSVELKNNSFTVESENFKVQNSEGNVLLSADTTKKYLTLKGEFSQYCSNGKKSVSISGNQVKFYDWDRSGDFVGGLAATRNEGIVPGRLTLYGDSGNPLHLGIARNADCEGFSNVQPLIVLADNDEYSDKINFLNDITMVNYTDIKLTNDSKGNSVMGTIALGSTNNKLYVMSNADANSSVNIGGRSGNSFASYMNVNSGGITVYGNIACTSNKLRAVKTKSYGTVGQNAYETCSPYFGDIGRCTLDKDGICYIFFDEVFKETVNTSYQYEVDILDVYGNKNMTLEELKELVVHCVEMTEDYFILKGTPRAKVAWEVKVRQIGYELNKLEKVDIEDSNVEIDYSDIEKQINEDNNKKEIFEKEMFYENKNILESEMYDI